MGLLSFLPVVSGILDKVIPDKNAREKAKRELNLLEQRGELKLMLGQLRVNANEAKHSSMFVAGWRPFIGWVCGLAFGYHFLVQPIVVFVSAVAGVPIELPAFDMNSLLTVMLGMLGLGGMRSFEKYKGIERNNLKGE